MTDQYGPKGEGAIWPHKKTADSHPDFRGHIKITLTQLETLVAQAKSSNEQSFQIDIALWDRTSKKGGEYKFISTEVSSQENKSEPRRTFSKKPWD
tara:strand:+ start:510 stop:797 length:288 start_codon:yes stop_codon:yes gene_type:complete